MEEDKSFEGLLKRLEEIVSRLETNGVSLEESLDLFEEGIRISKECERILSAARKRVQKLVQESDGTFQLQFLDDEKAEGSSGDGLQEEF